MSAFSAFRHCHGHANGGRPIGVIGPLPQIGPIVASSPLRKDRPVLVGSHSERSGCSLMSTVVPSSLMELDHSTG